MELLPQGLEVNFFFFFLNINQMVDYQFVALAKTRNSSMGPPGRIDLMIHHTINRCSTTISCYPGHVVILIFQAVKFSADFSDNEEQFIIKTECDSFYL